MSETQEITKNRTLFVRILTSKFLWLVIIFLLIIAAVIRIASDKIEEARSTYPGLPQAGGFSYSFVKQDYFSRDEYNFLSYEDDEYYTRRGIDVSEFQGEIDWTLVKESGVEFAMIRLGYRANSSGELNLDARFQENIKGAYDAGIDVGVYFFSQALTVDEAIKEAQFVCKNIKSKYINMPIAFDMEPLTLTESDRIHGLKMRDITEIADAFCTVIEKHGYDAVIYGNPTWIYHNINLSLLPERKIWLAHYTHFSGFPYEYTIWQYTDSGVIGGIETLVDLDLQFVKKQ